MDNFKQYLQQHKEEAYTDEPSAKLWNNIQQQATTVSTAKVVIFKFSYAVAACCILLLGFGIFFFYNNNHQPSLTALNNIAPADTTTITNATIAKVATQPEINTVSVNKPTQPTTIQTNPKFVKNSQKNIKTKPTSNAANNSLLNQELEAFASIETGFKQVINLQKQRINTTPLQAENPLYYTDFITQFKQLEKDEKGVKENIINKGITNENLEQLISIYQYKLNVLKQLQNEINKTNSRYKTNRAPVDTIKTYFLNL